MRSEGEGDGGGGGCGSSPFCSAPSIFSNPYLYLYALGSFSNGLFISLRGPILPELALRVGCDSAALGTFLGLVSLTPKPYTLHLKA